MPAVEFARIKLKSGCDELECRDIFLRSLQSQDEWIREHQPHMNISQDDHFSSLYITRTDPAFLLITASWDSIEAHDHWIASDVNQAGFGEWSRFIATDDDAVLLLHWEPLGTLREAPPSFSIKQPLVVQRIFTDTTEKDSIQRNLEDLQGGTGNAGQEDQYWAGWRIDKSDGAEELVVFRPYDTPTERIAKTVTLSPKAETHYFQPLV